MTTQHYIESHNQAPFRDIYTKMEGKNIQGRKRKKKKRKWMNCANSNCNLGDRQQYQLSVSCNILTMPGSSKP